MTIPFTGLFYENETQFYIAPNFFYKYESFLFVWAAFSTVSEGQSQGVTDFSSAQFNMSEDSNSEFKKLECANNVKNV